MYRRIGTNAGARHVRYLNGTSWQNSTTFGGGAVRRSSAPETGWLPFIIADYRGQKPPTASCLAYADHVLYVSGKCSVSWSAHMLLGSVALLLLCFGLSFCAARHKPSHPHPLRIWQSRYSQSINAYAQPAEVDVKDTSLSFVTIC